MNTIISIDNLKELILSIRGEEVLLDADVASIYGVETKRINEAVKNNLDKFPDGYLIELDKSEWELLKTKFSTSIKGGKVKLPTAFTEKGLYMLATILKSHQATQATISIIETFAKIRSLSRSIKELSVVQNKAEQKTLMQRSGELIADILDDGFQTNDTETSIELNLAILKFKHTIKQKRTN
ncbi:MAG: ORF6N domain-containing protein [Rhodocyclaceae bacterium]|nr:ORF6N domain-containing protein [Rhodocyclaceae bacterium]